LRLPLAVATAVAAVGTLASCGVDDAADARETAAAWLSALAESDGKGACALMAPELVAQATPSCEVVYGGYGEVLGETLGAAGLAVDDLVAGNGDALVVDVTGDRAAVRVVGDIFRPIELRLTAEGWRVVSGLRPAP
jgi:hypothetical protein